MTSADQSTPATSRRVPLSLCPERLGLVSTLALSLISLGGLVVLVGGALAMLIHTRHLEARTDMAAVRTENRKLEQELASLNQRLTGLWDVLLEARTVVETATRERSVGDSPWYEAAEAVPGLGTGIESGDPAEMDQLGETLRQAREVSDCFELMLARMEGNADAWRGLPTIQPVSSPALSSGFGLRTDPFTGRLGWHQGLDFPAPTGTPVRATAGGVVVRAEWFGNYGRLVEIDHGNGLTTRYAHLSQVLVKRGDRIDRQTEVGLVGTTGRSNAPHLHYEVHLYGRPVNPAPYLFTEFASGTVGSSARLLTAAPHLE